MDSPDRSARIPEARTLAPGDRKLSASMREARIQGALDDRRSRSSISASLHRSLSIGEEDESQGKAGDSGSARRSGNFGDGRYTNGDDINGHNVNGDNVSGELSMKRYSGTNFTDSMRLEQQLPFKSNLTPLPRSLSHVGNVQQDNSGTLHRSLELVSILAYLTTFGILGVIIRYLLEVLFDQDVANVTSNESALFIDLPANMLGSFFMGWVGVVFKKDIAMYSEHLAVGLSTGLMGSITTYAAMMQRNLAIMVTDKWVTGLFGLLIGVYLSIMSLVVGEDTARLLLKIIQLLNSQRERKGLGRWEMPSPDNLKRRKAGLVLFVFIGGGLWVASAVLTMLDTNSTTRRTLWLACWVAPPGVWIRWYFARLNGRGIGPKNHYRWFPTGTFLVNVTASSLEAGLSAVESRAGNYIATLLVGAINLGTLGCLSTVSTFVAEIQAMHEGSTCWRSYAYPIISMLVSLVIGILIYGVPVWSKTV